MPKQIYKIDQFHGGLSNNSDPRDIADNELSEAQDVMVDEVGRIRMMGGPVEGYIDAQPNSISPGYGLFQFSHDRVGGEDTGDTENETGANYLAFADADTSGKVSIYSDEDTIWGDDPITGFSNNSSGEDFWKPIFYFVDGTLRISDGEFRNTNVNKWYGYVYGKFFQDINGDPTLTLSKWALEDQKLKSFSDLGIDVDLVNCNGNNPEIGNMVADQIIIGFWTEDEGTWNGSYVLGAAPVYIGGQEGPITENNYGALTFFDEVLFIQVFVCHPTITSSSIASHPLKDNRITGIKVYIRSFPSEDWYLLEEVDLKAGGKFGWDTYEADTDKDSGHWSSGSEAGGSDVSISGLSTPNQYSSATVIAKVHNLRAFGTSTSGQNRKGTLRITGFNSVVYREVNLNDEALQTFADISVVNPTSGSKKFLLEVFDENFGILTSRTQEVTIAVGDEEAPPEGDYEYGGEAGGGYS